MTWFLLFCSFAIYYLSFVCSTGGGGGGGDVYGDVRCDRMLNCSCSPPKRNNWDKKIKIPVFQSEWMGLRANLFFIHTPKAGDICLFVHVCQVCVWEPNWGFHCKYLHGHHSYPRLMRFLNLAAALAVQIASLCRQLTDGVNTAQTTTHQKDYYVYRCLSKLQKCFIFLTPERWNWVWEGEWEL